MNIRKAILIFVGTVCVGLGVVGMFLPLMPTTVFLLIAAYCYSRSSDRFHEWLLNNRWCGEYIRNYKEGKGMTARHKITAILTLWSSIALSIWFLNARFWPTLALAVTAASITLYLLLLKTYRPETKHESAQADLA